MKRTTALGLVAAVFLVGLAGGMLGARLMHLRLPAEGPRLGEPPFRSFFVQEDLRLTREQREALEEVFQHQREKFELLHAEVRPRVDRLMQETQVEIEEILTAEQLEHFRARMRRWKQRSNRFGPPGRDPRHRFGRPPPAARPETDDD